MALVVDFDLSIYGHRLHFLSLESGSATKKSQTHEVFTFGISEQEQGASWNKFRFSQIFGLVNFDASRFSNSLKKMSA
jgi:hypothetical protein